MNSTKRYLYNDGYILVTVSGNFYITNNFIKPTDVSVESLEETVFDIGIQATIDNASISIAENVSFDFSRGLALLINEKIEDFD